MTVTAPRNPPSTSRDVGAGAGPIGDREGEHLMMARGQYTAWIHVGVAFFYELLLLAGTVGLLIGGLAGLAADAITDDHDVIGAATIAGDAAAAIGIAWWIFRDRWRCIEAFASRSCAGLLNLSLVYVPVVALVYANWRGLQKLRRR
jgi:hypothetical protein